MSENNKSQNLAVITIQIADITVGERIRREQGDIKELAENIAVFGHMNPITVVESEEGRFSLVAGYRRLCAAKYLGWNCITANVLPELDSEEGFLMEISENEIRKNFTVSERLEYALRLKEIEAVKAKQRMSVYGRNKVASSGSNGRVRDIVAKMTGFSSGVMLDRTIFIAKNRPDLLEKVDRKEITVFSAYQTAKKETGSGENISKNSIQQMPELPPLFVPEEVKTSGIGMEGAGHEELMQNPVYHTLYDRYMELVKTVSQMVCQTRETKRSHEAEVRDLKLQLKSAKSKSAN